MARRTSSVLSRATIWSNGRSRTALKVSWCEKGWVADWKPTMREVGLPATCGTSQAPCRLAATPRLIHSRQSSGAKSACRT